MKMNKENDFYVFILIHETNPDKVATIIDKDFYKGAQRVLEMTHEEISLDEKRMLKNGQNLTIGNYDVKVELKNIPF